MFINLIRPWPQWTVDLKYYLTLLFSLIYTTHMLYWSTNMTRMVQSNYLGQPIRTSCSHKSMLCSWIEWNEVTGSQDGIHNNITACCINFHLHDMNTIPCEKRSFFDIMQATKNLCDIHKHDVSWPFGDFACDNNNKLLKSGGNFIELISREFC